MPRPSNGSVAFGLVEERSITNALPTHTPFEYLLLAEGIAAGIGLLAGVAPAWRAARLDPIEALRAE